MSSQPSKSRSQHLSLFEGARLMTTSVLATTTRRPVPPSNRSLAAAQVMVGAVPARGAVARTERVALLLDLLVKKSTK